MSLGAPGSNYLWETLSSYNRYKPARTPREARFEPQAVKPTVPTLIARLAQGLRLRKGEGVTPN